MGVPLALPSTRIVVLIPAPVAIPVTVNDAHSPAALLMFATILPLIGALMLTVGATYD